MDDAQKIEYVIEYTSMQLGAAYSQMQESQEMDRFFFYKGKLHAYNEILRVLNEENQSLF